MAACGGRKHVLVNYQMQPHVAFRVRNFWLNNHWWLRTNSSLKHHLDSSCDWLIVARHTNLPVACVLAVTLALLSLKFGLSLAVLSASFKWALSCSLPLFLLLPLRSPPSSQLSYHDIWETFSGWLLRSDWRKLWSCHLSLLLCAGEQLWH